MNSIGERLREERLRRGFSIEQIAESTKINPSLLEAIEADDLERLPGTFFTRSFVRQYAAALGLDAAELEPELDRVAAVEQQVQEPGDEPPREVISVPPMDSGLGGFAGPSRPLGALISFVLIVAACSGLYILWQRSRQPQSATIAKAEPAAAQPAPPKTVPAPQQTQPAQPQPQQTPVQQTAAPAQAAPAPVSEAPANAPAPDQPAATSAAPTQPRPTLSTLTAGQPPAVTVQIRATEAVWIRVAGDGKFLFSGTLQPDDSRNVEAGQLIQLRAGNAAGIEVIWNGKPVGPIGPEGQVRNMEFTPEGFKVLAPPPPKPVEPYDGL